MTALANIEEIMNQPWQIQVMRRAVEIVADRAAPIVDISRPYVDGLHNLPADGRFLLVGNHTQGGAEAMLIPYFVRRVIGTRVRPLVDRNMARMGGPAGDLLAAVGGVVGAPETARELMRNDEPILVFPGGGREIPKFRGEENTLRWQGRTGFARLAAEFGYPIVTAGLVGGDDVYRSFTTRDSRWGRFSQRLGERVLRRSDMAMPLVHGIGPTLIPRPQRMYLRFAPPIDTKQPESASDVDWVTTVKQRAQASLERTLAELQEIRSGDPYRQLNPLARREARLPSEL